MNTDLNKNTCQWKHLAKNICDYIRNEKNTWVIQGNDIATFPDKLGELSIDEITELAIYDSTSSQVRKELVEKKVRRVYVDSFLVVRILFKNTFPSIALDVKNIRL